MTLDDILSNLRARSGQLAADALLRDVDHVLVLCDDRLFDLGAGQSVVVDVSHSASPDSLADAAERLLGYTRQIRKESRKIVLLLPSPLFFTTQVNFPGMTPGAIQAALKLQSHNILPVFDEPLVFGINTQAPQVVIWASQHLLDNLFAAFSARQFFLAAIAPRAVPLAIAQTRNTGTAAELLLIESDRQTDSMLAIKNGALTSFVQTQRSDLADPEFADEWQALLLEKNSAGKKEFNTVEQIIASLRGIETNLVVDLLAPYSIMPSAALQSGYRFSRSKWRSMITAAAVVVLALGALPFTIQSLQLFQLERRYADIAEQAAPAREDQRYIRNFEAEWGVLTEFPRQNLDQVMIALQEVIAPGYLTSIDVESGYISIEGDSQDPQNLLERLEQNELFTEVDFARATNNTRYFIDLRLATVNYPAYQEWYFPESAQR